MQMTLDNENAPPSLSAPAPASQPPAFPEVLFGDFMWDCVLQTAQTPATRSPKQPALGRSRWLKSTDRERDVSRRSSLGPSVPHSSEGSQDGPPEPHSKPAPVPLSTWRAGQRPWQDHTLVRVARTDKGPALHQEDLGSKPYSPVHLLRNFGPVTNPL